MTKQIAKKSPSFSSLQITSFTGSKYFSVFANVAEYFNTEYMLFKR